MFGYDYKNRFDLGKLESNVLMNQIRAEKKIYSSKNLPSAISTHRQHTGKRIYQDILYKPTLSPRKENNPYNSQNSFRGKRMIDLPLRIVEERSRSGKKRFEDNCRKQTLWRTEVEPSPRNGIKRLDHSPTHQGRTTICLKWN